MKELPGGYAPPDALLRERCILVTGAGDGLGRATALACARLGATVILAGRTVPRLEAVYDQIQQAGGPQAAIYPLNLAGASWNDYAELAATLQREFKALHGLVHCAAHFRNFGPLASLDPKEWLESLQVNLTAAFALTQHCLPLLAASGTGSVVFLSDAARLRAYAGAYGVAKFALDGLLQIWSQELEGEGRVRFNSLDPGPMDTALRRRGYADRGGADPSAAAAAVAWLLGGDSAPETGRAFSLRR